MLMSIFQDVGTYMGVLMSIPKSRMLMSTLVHTRKSCSKLISIFQDVGTYMGFLMSIDNKHIDNLTVTPTIGSPTFSVINSFLFNKIIV
jgi:hypothetical protein